VSKKKTDRRWWTDEEIAQLREWRNVVPKIEIARRLGRSKYAVQTKTNQLRLPPSPLRKSSWTAEEYDYLRQNYMHKGARHCASVLGRSAHACRIQATKIGVYVYQRQAGRPSRRLYLAALQVEADAAGIAVDTLLGCSRKRKIVHVRWRAWKTLYDTGRYSTTGIGMVAGYDHSSLCNAFQRLREQLAAAE
jgi:hypothetical protein